MARQCRHIRVSSRATDASPVLTFMDYGFKAVANPAAQLLIVGSFPGAESLTKREYYASPRNRLWPLMEILFGIDRSLSYHARTKLLSGNGIALWDVLYHCERIGSLDSRIEAGTENPNNFLEFFSGHPDIKMVCFNGTAAAKLYSRLAVPILPHDQQFAELATLPSTSPANASFSLASLAPEWKIVRYRIADSA